MSMIILSVLLLGIVMPTLVQSGDNYRWWYKYKDTCDLDNDKECNQKCVFNKYNDGTYECAEHPEYSKYCCRTRHKPSECYSKMKDCEKECSKSCWRRVHRGWVCYTCYSGLSTGAIIGISVAAGIILIIVVVVSCLYCMCCPWYMYREPVIMGPMPMPMPPPPPVYMGPPMYA